VSSRSGSIAITDINGYFELAGAGEGDKIQISFIGYEIVEATYIPGYEYAIVLEEDVRRLDEVAMVGYGTVYRQSRTNSVVEEFSYSTTLQGMVAGVMVSAAPGAAREMRIRGISSIDESKSSLIIIDGLPYDGTMEDLDPSTITSMDMLKDASLAAVYGARAANGVIIIQTNKLNTLSSDVVGMSEDQSNSMRRNFHDDAFWQPSLRTNEKGKASFEVVYPDDITSWQAYFLAIGNRHQTDKKQLTINSFKALTARLSTPQFAVIGDSFNAVGRIANHNSDSINVVQTIAVAGETTTKDVALKTSFVEQIPVKVTNGDSLTIAYSLQKADGYFDGEERKLPIIEQGLLQTTGEFKIITDTATMFFTPQPELGATTLYAEASSLDIFLREIEKVDQYPYYCNEQMASKVKALLLKKRIFTIFGKTFKEDKKIANLINRLNNNRNSEGLWGWWNKDKTAIWISKQIVEAMLAAEEAGYKTGLNKTLLATVLEKELKNGLAALATTTLSLPFAKRELLDRLIILKQLDAPVDYYAYYLEIEKQLRNNRTTADKLKEMLCLLTIGKSDKVERDTLMHYARETLLGTLYWGDNVNTSFFRLPHDNNTVLTLMAYDILKRMGNSDTALMKIRNYFFECRRAGSWQNIYEASRIIETILPDMMAESTYSAASMFVNGRKVSTFPHTEEITGREPVIIKKDGTLPLYVTTYQKGWATNPAAESSKGFVVKTHFNESRDTTAVLTAGTTAKLEIIVTVKADAEYVQIEIPIPSGCSYDSKRDNFYSKKETYREHFKEKLVIFCDKLTQGEHLFIVELLPRYTGNYILNPAKAELMYFPTFYGNEEVKKVEIRD
jgi:TonB-dependent SusC/RagA subfamily outer membrane receptor